MEQLRTELSHLLGEKLSRVECVSEKAATALWSLYDAQGNPMPLLARSFTTPGVARQLAWKISTLARSGTVRMPVVYGVMTHEEHPGPDVLLLERLRGVPVEAPTRTPARWEQLQEQIVEALLHRARIVAVHGADVGAQAGAQAQRFDIAHRLGDGILIRKTARCDDGHQVAVAQARRFDQCVLLLHAFALPLRGRRPRRCACRPQGGGQYAAEAAPAEIGLTGHAALS